MSTGIDAGRLVAIVPIVIGRAPDLEDVAVAGLRDSRVATLHVMRATGDRFNPRAIADRYQREILATARARGVDSFLVVGWEATGARWALVAGHVLERHRPVADTIVVDPVTNTWRRLQDDLSWSTPESVPPASAALAERAANARSRYLAPYLPAQRSNFVAAERAVVDRLAAMRPSRRGRLGVDALRRLSGPERDSTEMLQDRALVAHLLCADTYVRDHIVTRAIEDPALCRALVELYRTAPSDIRGNLAAAAAAAHYFQNGQPHPARTMLHYSYPRGAQEDLHQFLHLAIRRGLHGSALAPYLRDLNQASEDADALYKPAASAPSPQQKFKRYPGVPASQPSPLPAAAPSGPSI